MGSGQSGVNYASKPLSQSWSGPRTIFNGSSSQFGVSRVAVAADSDGLAHVAWTVRRGDRSLWYSFQRARADWAAPGIVTASLPGYDHNPSVAGDTRDGRHIVWDEGVQGDIWYAGLTGLPPVSGVITTAGGACPQRRARRA